MHNPRFTKEAAMKFSILGKGLCVFLIVVSCSIIGYTELTLDHGVVYQAFNPSPTAIDLIKGGVPAGQQIKAHIRDRGIAQMAFNAEIEEIMLRARIQRKVILSAV
jgi:hypothetical protein